MSYFLRLSLLLALLEVVPAMAYSTDHPYCALRIRVWELWWGDHVNVPDVHRLKAELVAELKTEAGEVVQRREVKDGGAEFCDLGFGRYSVVVEYSGPGGNCSPSGVESIKSRYGEERTVDVVMNPCRGGDGEEFSTGCLFYVRVSDGEGRPIAGAMATPGGIAGATGERADPYGRMLLALDPKDTIDFVFSAPGYASAMQSLHCAHADFEQKNVSVVLKGLKEGGR